MSSETPMPRPDLNAIVFGKTPRGREEMARRAARLTAKQRSMLIMLDGQKRLDEVSSLLPAHEVLGIVDLLLEFELIEVQGEAGGLARWPASAAMDAGKAPAPSPQADPEKLLRIKDMMTRSAEDHLGLMATEVVRRIDQAGDETQLLSVLGHWHMAMLASKRGKQVAGIHLEQIQASFRDA